MRRAQDRARSARSRKNGARSATIESRALGALKLASEARNENVPAKRADFFPCFFIKPANLLEYFVGEFLPVKLQLLNKTLLLCANHMLYKLSNVFVN